MTTYPNAVVAEQHRADLLAEADNYHRTRQIRRVTEPRKTTRQHYWGQALRAFMRDVRTAQL